MQKISKRTKSKKQHERNNNNRRYRNRQQWKQQNIEIVLNRNPGMSELCVAAQQNWFGWLLFGDSIIVLCIVSHCVRCRDSRSCRSRCHCRCRHSTCIERYTRDNCKLYRNVTNTQCTLNSFHHTDIMLAKWVYVYSVFCVTYKKKLILLTPFIPREISTALYIYSYIINVYECLSFYLFSFLFFKSDSFRLIWCGLFIVYTLNVYAKW